MHLNRIQGDDWLLDAWYELIFLHHVHGDTQISQHDSVVRTLVIISYLMRGSDTKNMA